MSILIIPSEFKNVRTGEISYGYRLFDEYVIDFEDKWETIPEEDLEFLREVIKTIKNYNNAEVMNAFFFLLENKNPISIGNTEYGYEQVVEIIEELWS